MKPKFTFFGSNWPYTFIKTSEVSFDKILGTGLGQTPRNELAEFETGMWGSNSDS